MRPLRIDYRGARHHVMNRGRRREPVFFDRSTRVLFLETLADLPRRFGVRVHGYALMPNHYHLMLESVGGDLPRAMRFLGSTYTLRLNKLRGWDGALFRGRYKSRLVCTEAYWRHLLLYLHLNPTRAGLPTGSWTSHGVYAGAMPRPDWLTTHELLALYGEAYRSTFEAALEGLVEPPPEFDAERLWGPNDAGLGGVPQVENPFDMHQALSDVAVVTGAPIEALLHAKVGRNGNPANWVTAWWMSEQGIAHGRIQRAMGARQSQISRKIRKVRERRSSDPTIAKWVAALEAKGKGDASDPLEDGHPSYRIREENRETERL